MLTVFKSGFFWGGMLLSLSACYGQSGPLGVLPMLYNSSFAGETSNPRISSNVRLRTGSAEYGKSYGLYSSYDQFIPAFRSGVGVTASYVRSTAISTSTYSLANNRYDYEYYSSFNYHVSIAIAPKFSLKGRFTLSPSLDIAYSSQKLASETPIPLYWEEMSNDHVIQSRAGILFNTNKFYIGYSVHLIDHYKRGYKNDTINFSQSGRVNNFTSYLQLGYTFRRSATSDFSFTPQLALFIGTNSLFSLPDGPRRLWDYFSPEALNLTFRYKKVIWGLNNTGVHVGYQSDRIKIMLSSIVGLAGRNGQGYTANLSSRYVFMGGDQ